MFDYSELFKITKILAHLLIQAENQLKTDKYIGVFAKLRVIERVAYNFKTLAYSVWGLDSYVTNCTLIK